MSETFYSLEGTLPSGCVHIYSLTQSGARGMIRAYGMRSATRRQWGASRTAEFPLRVRRSIHLARGYVYDDVRVTVTRSAA